MLLGHTFDIGLRKKTKKLLKNYFLKPWFSSTNYSQHLDKSFMDKCDIEFYQMTGLVFVIFTYSQQWRLLTQLIRLRN